MSKSNKEKAVEVKNKGNAAFQANNFTDAIKFYSEAIQLDPTDHTFFTNRSASYAGLNDHKKALDDANEAIKLNKNWMKGHYRRGAALFALGQIDDAYSAFKRAQELDSANPDIPKRLQEVDYEKKKQKQEKKAATAQGPNRGFAGEKEAGNEFYKAGKYDDAVICYTRALEAAKTDEEKVTALSNRAASLAQQKFYDRVIKDCTDAIKLDPDSKYPATTKAFMRRGLAYEDAEKWELALSDLRRVVLKDPNTRQASEAMSRINRNLEAKKKWDAQGK